MSDGACPFCGSHDIRLIHRSGAYDNDRIHCDGCNADFTYHPKHIGTVWNERTETDGGHCPFCGGEVEYDGNMNYQYLFPDVYCPTCGWYVQFQGVKAATTDKRDALAIETCRARTMRKARKAFGRRAT